jgi:hypothetical protein
MPASLKLSLMASGTPSVKVRLNLAMSAQASAGAGAARPLPCMRRPQSMSSDTPTKTFFGSQPRSWQVPPKGSESTTATLQPASRQPKAALWAAEPVPTTTRSTWTVICLPFSVAFFEPSQPEGVGQLCHHGPLSARPALGT